MIKPKTFDPTKLVCTRGGKPARILATDVKNSEYPVVAAVSYSEDHESVDVFTACGHYSLHWRDNGPSESDLINKIETTYSYHNVGHQEYNTDDGNDSLEGAIRYSRYANSEVQFVVRHTYEAGVLTAIDMAHSYVDHPETRA